MFYCGFLPFSTDLLLTRGANNRKRVWGVLGVTSVPLDETQTFGKLPFLMSEQFIVSEQALREFEYPQREAAFFYGLFLRGHSAEELRRDIEVPAAVLAKWDRESQREPHLRELLEKIVDYRRHVLAIFENLVGHDSSKQPLQ